MFNMLKGERPSVLKRNYFGMFCSIKHGGRGSYKTVIQHMANSVIAGIAAHVVSKSGLILDTVQTDAMMHHDAWVKTEGFC